MLKFSGLSLRRGRRELIHDGELTIHPGQRVGITGANGVGKSSLFAMIRGELQPDSGDCSLPVSWVIAHVAQETPALEKTALDYVIDGDEELRRIEARIELAQAKDQGEMVAKHYADLDAIDGYGATTRAMKLLHGLGFKPGEETRSVKSFSGGWRMRLNLAQSLMCRSDLLLLDEPTNHLDLETVLWLEDWLRAYPGTLLLISHDRDFLDRVVTHIVHIENTSLKIYTGNYSEFEFKRAEQLAQQQSLFQRQQKEIAHIQSYIDRFRAKATKARQAQSRIKALERMERISQAHVDSPFHFYFYQPEKSPDQLIVLDQVTIGYQDRSILSGVKLEVRKGDRLGLLGENGAGKSTLIKTLAGELPLQSGERIEARELKIGYFAQHQLEQLDGQASPLLHLQRLDKTATEQTLRNFLGGFGFDGDMIVSQVEVFSGGEKARLVLAMLVYQKPNLLLLDEPTNHLDLEMRQALTTALQDFDGAMVVVSHDRHLLRTSTDSLVQVSNGKVAEFNGDLDDYFNYIREQRRDEDASASLDKTSTQNKRQQRQDAAQRRKELQPLRNKLKKLDAEVERLSQRKRDIEQELAGEEIYEEKNKDKLKELMQQQMTVSSQLQQAEELWMSISEELEGLE